MLRFDIDTWKKRPDLYPMVVDVPILPSLSKPVLKSDISADVHHGDILVARADGSWHAMPEDVYRKNRSEFNG